jgi:tetratricopeptide (TPR) repeat protein
MKKKYTYLVAILLIVASFVAFSRIARNDFINFDDNIYITENNYVQSGINPQTIKWAFSAVVSSNWHPLTLLSHALDWNLFGANASGHHILSLLLHIGAIIFLFLFLYKTTNNIWSAAFAAALFALHPLRVESVAWAAERKDVLSMFFGMAALFAYAFYAESYKLSKYCICLILFVLSLMSKPMLVTLPFILLLLDYWPLGRWQKALSASPESRYNLAGRLVCEKVPFILLTIASCIATVWAQNKGGSVASLERLQFLERLSNAIFSYIVYLGKIFWPVNLAVFYPFEHSLPLWEILISGIIVILITLAVLYYIKKLPFLFVGWFWYLGTLIPVIGLVQVGGQMMADRYTYLPSIGVSVMLAWGIPLLFKHEDARKKILFPVAISLLIIISILTWEQCGYWKNSDNLFNHALRLTKNNYIAHNNLGLSLLAEGKNKDAIGHFNKALSLYKEHAAEFYNNRGLAYANLGQYQLSIKDYNEAIRLKTDLVAAYNNRGLTYIKLGRYQQAVEDYNEVIRLKPDYAYAYYFREIACANLGQHLSTIEDYNKIIRLKPDYADAYSNRGMIYGKQGQYKLAIEDFNNVIRLKPDDANAYSNRGFTYANLGQYQRAIEDYNEAIHLKPDDYIFYSNRGVAYLQKGDNTLGCHDAQKACALGNCKTLESAKGIGLCR